MLLISKMKKHDIKPKSVMSIWEKLKDFSLPYDTEKS